MSLSDALSIAMSGLRTNQVAMSLVSSNVANAESPGYVRKTLNQVATNSGAYGTDVRTIGVNRELDQYIQAQLRTESSGAGYASLRSNFLQQLQSLYGNPGSVGTLEDCVQQADHGGTGAVDQRRQPVGAHRRRQRGECAGEPAQFDDAGRSDAARRCRKRHRRFRQHRQQPDVADRDHQQAADEQSARRHLDRCIDGGPARPARSLHHAIVRTDGHSCHRQRRQPGYGFHDLRRGTRRQPGGQAFVRRAGNGHPQYAMEFRPVEEQPRLGGSRIQQWRIDQSDRHGRHQVRKDRSLYRIARQVAGRRAEPARPVRSFAVQRNVGQDHGGHRGHVRPAVGIRSGRRRPEGRQRHPSHLHGHRDQYAARNLDHARR